ncbi:hypothetical protein V1264_023753 [Littorina saxatilis]|uniref:PLAT domain-containing protein n=1 Tax=Littorina saxatilis TaxID=31220 RepID=A0AAN9B7S5_9CAEN
MSSSHVPGSSVCFKDLGCFSTGPPFFDVYRPISILPESPSFINPKFTLFTRQAPSTGHKLSAGDEAALRGSSFLASRPTKFVVHGFIDNGGTDWMAEMKNEFLTHGDYNVVLVDWGSGSLALYGQATANTRVVGAMIAQLIMFMKNVTGARPEDMHILGHSLGAHVAGYAGERLTYLGRITGMDPAEPYFQNEDKVVRLDPTDALFVDIIHTDGSSFYSTDLGFGMGQSCGHVDYFPNGGHDQPGCEEGPITHILHEGILAGAKEFVACNHLRSYHFFIESINSACPFEGYKCDSEDNFNTGGCVPCSGDGCGYMGMNADKVKPRRGVNHVKYYLKTGTHGPYCRYHYRVALTFGGTQRLAHSERGQMYVHLTGSTGETHEVKVTHDNTYVTPGQTYSYLVTAPVDLGVIHDVVFRWDHDSNVLDVGSWNLLGLRHPTLYLDKISVANGESHKTFNFCEHSTAVESNHFQTVSTTC